MDLLPHGCAPYPRSATITVRWLDRLRIGPTRPRALGRKRRSVRPLSAVTRTTYSSVGSRLKFDSALAAADLTTLANSRAARCGKNCSVASASVTFLPRITSATSPALRGEPRTLRATARTSIPAITVLYFQFRESAFERFTGESFEPESTD